MEILLFVGLFVAWVLVTICAEDEKSFLATLVVGLTALVFELLTPFKAISLALAHPYNTLLLFGTYVAAGVVWSFLKWVLFVYEVKRKQTEHEATGTGVRWYTYRFTIPLQVGEHKGRITAWMMFWPMSAVWTVINDPIRRSFAWAYNQVSGTFQRISDNAFGQ